MEPSFLHLDSLPTLITTPPAMRLSYAFFLAAYTVYTSASLYPTTPVAPTTWIAGTPHWTTWLDDKTSPRLSTIGPVTINMYSENDVSLSLRLLRITDAVQDFRADPGSQCLTYETETQSTHPQVHLFRRFEIVRLFFTFLDISPTPAIVSSDSSLGGLD